MDAKRQISAATAWLSLVLAATALGGCGAGAGGASGASPTQAGAAASGVSSTGSVQGQAGASSAGAAAAQLPATSAGGPTLSMSPMAAGASKQVGQLPSSSAPLGTAGASSGAAAPPSAGNAAPAGSAMVEIEHPEAKRSAGCGMPAPMAGDAMIDVMGTKREYILALPQGYDSNTPYKLIFAWHGLGGSAQQVASNWYGLSRMAQNTVIFVAGQGLMTSTSVGDGAGWPNTNGQDVAFVKALYAQLQGQLCIDENRVFSTGMSYGGIMSNTLGCQMGDVLRAIAPMSGSGPGFGGRGAMCVGQVAVWMSHGDNDMVVPTSAGLMSRDYWVNANHCQMPGVAVDPSPCVAYTACDKDLPVTFCEFSGGHTVPPFASAAIWSFFSQF